jgi:uncharacterized protein YukE
MTTCIQMNREELNVALENIKNAQIRSENNNSSFKDDVVAWTDASSVIAYQSAIGKLKEYLKKYNEHLIKDLTNLDAAATVLEETDLSMCAVIGQ